MDRKIALNLLVGEPTREEAAKNDGAMLEWATPISTQYLGPLCWQPFGSRLQGNELVIVTQENKLLYNHWLIARPRRFSLAFWGHGGNFQALPRASSIRERYKRWTTTKVDWWFTYTDISTSRVISSGFPANRITTLNNSVDTEQMARDRARVSPQETAELKRRLGLRGPVGIFIGSLYSEKRLPFLLAAAKQIRSSVPNFSLLILGDGPDREALESLVENQEWIHFLGHQSGVEKARYAMAADLMLNPGLVGLGILDAFVFRLPLVTTDCKLHSPEIAYLRHEFNGLMIEPSVHAYAESATKLLNDRDFLDRLIKGCETSAKQYSLDGMIDRFEEGILLALGAKRRRASLPSEQ